LLAGGWDDKSESDRRVLSLLGDTSYEAVVAAIAPFAGPFDRPLQKVGSAWRVNSPQDAWLLLASYLSPADVDRFEEVATTVFATADPRFEMTGEERWYAPVNGVRPEYSQDLRRGLGEILIMLALFGSRARLVPNADRRAERIVYKLLKDADGQRWWSLSGDFQLLAEAAPDTFLSAIRHSLDQPNPPIAALFKSDSDPMFGREYLSHLLWALESLGWSPLYFGQVAPILARLDEMDPGGRYGNRPGNSLRELFVLWLPQTGATLVERLKVLDVIRKRSPAASWKLMLGILPSGHDSLTPAATPRWRDLSPGTKEKVTYALIQQGAGEVSSRLLHDVGVDPARWNELLERLSNFPDRIAVIEQLAHTEPKVTEPAARGALWAAVRRALHRHRQIPDAEWALPPAELTELDKVYAALTPADPIARTTWLFGRGVGLPNPIGGWQGEAQQLQAERSKAAAVVLEASAVNGVLALAEAADDSVQLGVSLIQANIDVHDRDVLIERSLRSGSDRLQDLAYGMIAAAFQTEKEAWIERLLTAARAGNWGDRSILTTLSAVPQNRWTWNLSQQAGPNIELEYWRRTPVYAIQGDDQDVQLAAERLVTAQRARDAVTLLGNRIGETIDGKPQGAFVPAALLVKSLKEAARQPWADEDRNAAAMFQHYVVLMLRRLDSMDGVPEQTMLELEWTYLSLLEYSQRPPKVIMRALARDPNLFVDLLSALYRPSPESGVIEEPPADMERAKRFATHAFDILRQWDVVPGTNSQGQIDRAQLDAWVKDARKLAHEKGREAIADQKIGEVLSASPLGEDGIWPALAVREVIETAGSAHLEEGFVVGHYNRRGVTRRSPRDGGSQERDLVKQFQGYAKETALEWGRTSAVLARIAKSYGEDARAQDEDAESFDR
jgi:hypothetical protein